MADNLNYERHSNFKRHWLSEIQTCSEFEPPLYSTSHYSNAFNLPKREKSFEESKWGKISEAR